MLGYSNTPLIDIDLCKKKKNNSREIEIKKVLDV